MKDEVGLDLSHGPTDRFLIANVGIDVAKHFGLADRASKKIFRLSGQRQSDDFRAQFGQPQTEPRSFEAGISGQEYPFAGERAEHRGSQGNAHGALPVAQSSLSNL